MFYQWNIIGHEKNLLFLEEKLKERAERGFPHALLFVGPDNIGKFTVAKTLAQILQRKDDLVTGYHIDTIEMDDDGTSLKIDQMRDIIGRLNMTSQSPYKILLLGNIGRLTEEAGNSLLKMLEEPTGRAIFIFTASTIREVLPTIRSRMQMLKFTLLTEEILKTALRKQYPEIPENTLDQVMMLSLGKPGRAISLISNPEKLVFYRELFDRVQRFADEKNITERFQFIQSIVEDSFYLKEFLILLTAYLRHQVFTTDDEKKQRYFLDVLVKLQNTFDLLRRNINPRLLLENFSL